MGFFKGIKRIFKGKPKQEPTITDEMRMKALETRRLNAQIDAAEKSLLANQRLAALQKIASQGLEESGGSKTEEMLMTMLMTAFMKPQSNTQTQAQMYGATPQPISNRSVNSEQNAKVAQFLAAKIPDSLTEQLENLSDDDFLDIKTKVILIKHGA
jgi:hypothetical protein